GGEPRPWGARGDVGAPAAPARDLDLALAERRLTEDAEGLLAIGEPHLADAESRGLLEQHVSKAGGRDVPHLHGDRGAALLHPNHRGVAVADRPETIVWHRR